jgi:hypothetical protein
MPGSSSEHIKNIAVCIVLTLVTCGIYNLYWQYQQMLTVNELLQEDKYNFWFWLLLTLVTCGLYHVYHEYRLSEDIAKVCRPGQKNDGLISLVLSIFGLSIVVDAIQQAHINSYYGHDGL